MKYVQTYNVDPNGHYTDAFNLAIDMVKEQYDCHWNKFSATDYKVNYPRDNPPKYHQILTQLLEPYITQYCEDWHCQDYTFKNIWFAEYYDGAKFGWHTHEGSNMSGVYVIELDDPRNATQTLSHPNNEMTAGDLILFPAMMPHRSPKVTNGYKLVIGFNWNMYSCTLPND